MKDEAKRLTIDKVLTGTFFKSAENTTDMANSAAALGQAVRSVESTPPPPPPSPLIARRNTRLLVSSCCQRR